jgi:hypothetical protein
VADGVALHTGISCDVIFRASMNFLSTTFAQFYASDGLGSSHMLIAKVPAAIAAMLLMASVSAQAMEFADRPGIIFDVVGSLSAIRGMPTNDYSRRQINKLNILLPVQVAGTKLVERPKPISNVISTKLSQSENRPGRLSAEFSAVAEGSGMRFEYGPGLASGWLKPTATYTVTKFDYRPGPIANLFPTWDAVNITDRGFTSSLSKTTPLYEIQLPEASGVSCVGSMAPCGSLSFTEHFRTGSLSATYHDKRL